MLELITAFLSGGATIAFAEACYYEWRLRRIEEELRYQRSVNDRMLNIVEHLQEAMRSKLWNE